MAQLVLTLAGGVLGGGIGGGLGQSLGALFGAYVGGIVDQQLFGPQQDRKAVEGARVTDVNRVDRLDHCREIATLDDLFGEAQFLVGYRARIEANEDVRVLLEKVFLDSAGWCLANPSLARLALAPAERPSLEPPTDRPSFQRLVRDILVLGQRQGVIRTDDDPNFMSLVLLGIYGQAMLTALAGGPFSENDVKHIIRIVIEGIGEKSPPSLT